MCPNEGNTAQEVLKYVRGKAQKQGIVLGVGIYYTIGEVGMVILGIISRDAVAGWIGPPGGVLARGVPGYPLMCNLLGTTNSREPRG